MTLSSATRSAWAKYSRDSGDWLSLERHSADSAAVAGLLWDRWLPLSTKRILAEGRTFDEARTLGSWLAGTHDTGKLSPAFATQVEDLAAPMRAAGLEIKPAIANRSMTPHSLVSHIAIAEYLVVQGWDPLDARSFAVIAGGHHGTPPVRRQLLDDPKRAHFGDDGWAVCRNELLDYITKITGARAYFGAWSARALSVQEQALWTGFVIMSDWIASNDELFPLGENRDSVRTAEQMWERLAFLPPWEAHPPGDLAALLKARFRLPDDVEPRSMQFAAVDAARGMVEPGMLIVEAAMGTGKTEAALAAAEVLAQKFGQGGVFFALPTMATSNAMFERVLGWIEAQDGLAAASAVLAHSKASLNPSYRELQSESALGVVGDDVCDRGATVIAHSWMSGRKRGLLAEFVVGTVDQLLFAALKAKHVMLRHLAFANKVIIVDEVHAADTYMREYLKRSLEWLGAYGVPVVLLSATLPSEQRVALVQAYQSGKDAHEHLMGDIGYPVITVCQASGVEAISVEDTSAPKTVGVVQLDDELDSLVELLTDLLADGGCAGIVRNTVGRAQETARVLAEQFPDDVTLVHSRFLAQHRSDLEAALVKQLGPNGQRPARRIVVGTQVIEQSLDIDFDVMISDLAPIDLLFQRMGRLHRHSSTVRPERVRDPRFFVTGVVNWASDLPVPITASSRIYTDVLLVRTLAVLRERWCVGSVELPRDIAELVQLAYGENVPIPQTWAADYRDATARDVVEKNRTRLEASSFLLPGPYAEETLVDWLAENVGEADGPRGQAKVRDTDEGIEVIVTQRIGENVHLPEQCGGAVIDTDFAPSGALSRQALTATVRLPMQLTGSWRIDQTLDELEQRCYSGWQDSKWLAGELVLELDAEGCAHLAGFDIRYHSIEGLIVTKEEL